MVLENGLIEHCVVLIIPEIIKFTICLIKYSEWGSRALGYLCF